MPPELLTPAHHAPRRPSQHPSALRQLLLLLPLPPPSPPPPPPPLLLPPLLCTISSSPPSRWCTWSTSARRTTSARKTSGCPSCSSGCRWVLGLALGLRGCHSTLAGSVVLSTAASQPDQPQPQLPAWSSGLVARPPWLLSTRVGVVASSSPCVARCSSLIPRTHAPTRRTAATRSSPSAAPWRPSCWTCPRTSGRCTARRYDCPRYWRYSAATFGGSARCRRPGGTKL